jgi:glycosyltransferase involved in cell wall biosynthesis
VLLYVGRLAREKNVDFLLKALEVLRRGGEFDPLLVLVGDGPHRRELEETAANLGLQNHVRWAGGVPHGEVFRYYAAADVFTFASLSETQGLVVAEALSCGLPAVALDGPGVSEFVEPSAGGFLTANSIEAFLHPVAALLRDGEMREEASARGRKAGSRWSSRRQAERLVEVYESMLGRTPPGRPPIIRRALATVSAGIAAGDRVIRRRRG